MLKKQPIAANSYPDAKPLEVRGLYKKYSPKADFAVADISFCVEKGEITGILGPNGAGKSTILKCLTGLLPFSDGEVTISGYSIKSNPVEAKRNFSFVTDNHSVFVKMTGLQYLAFMADVYKVPTDIRAEKIAELEKVFGLGDSVNGLISGYSHGMKQKICMMGSLMHSPNLWILDEPMIGLDPRTQNSVKNFMRSYADAGNSILFSSHNIDAIEKVCDRAIVINNGKIVSDTTVGDYMNENPDGYNRFFYSGEEVTGL